MKFAAAGDILIMKHLPEEYEGLKPIRQFLNQAEVRMANLETTITDGTCYASAYSGGTWLTAKPSLLEDVKKYGFNMLGVANNHTMDYSYEGLFQTEKELRKSGISYAGIGKNLYEASKPAILETRSARTAVIDICSTFENAARAGSQTERQPGRPGLNPLRFKTVYQITKKHADELTKIAEKSYINGLREQHVKQGFLAPPPKGSVDFAGNIFEIVEMEEQEGRYSYPDKRDVDRTVASIQEALCTCDYVIVMVHSHEIKTDSDMEADYFLENFARTCIDAGASAVIGNGTHQLKGIEIYKERPIFYCLGNFIFENEYVRLLPADYMEKYNLSIHSSAALGIAERNRNATQSLYSKKEIYRTVLPCFDIEDGRCTYLRLMPIDLGMDKRQYYKNIPYVADTKTAEEITEYLNEACKTYGTKFTYRNGIIFLTD